MNRIRSGLRAVSRGALAVLCIASATAQVPSAAQLQLLQTLDPAARQQVLDQLGSGANGSTIPLTRPVEAPVSAVPIEVAEIAPEDLTLQARGFVLIEVASGADGLSGRERLIQDRNPYQLDPEGYLRLPGVPAIALVGLTEAQANKRLALEPSLRGLALRLARLPVQPMGQDALKPFGYDLFAQAPSTFAPITDIPVPAEYPVGAGDQINVQLYGAQSRLLRLVVNREGQLNFPDLGPITVAGKTFEAVRSELETRVREQMIGTEASISMGDTRAIRVFVSGEARRPGNYTVSGLASMISALYAAGGIKETGSLRNIELKRRGEVVARLDLYDLLLRGDTRDDAKLQPGDVVFVPTVGATVGISGEVRRPARYELKAAVSIEALVELAGGVTPEANTRELSVLRVSPEGRRVALSFALEESATPNAIVVNGDSIFVPRLTPVLDAGIQISGHVYQPRTVAWRDGLRLSQLIRSADELKPNADLGYVLIRRETGPQREVSVVSGDLIAAWQAPGSDADVVLAARDRIMIFDRETDRSPMLTPLLAELARQASDSAPTQVVTVQGQVHQPGSYPLEAGMRVSDLLRAGGHLTDAAFSERAELTRYEIRNAERVARVIEINLGAILAGNSAEDVSLQAFDILLVRVVPEWSEQLSITLEGQVRFPGTYSIRPGETLRSVLERAGGLSESAYPRAAVFTRKELQAREAAEIQRLTERLQTDLAAFSIQAGQSAEGATASQGASSAIGLLNQLKNVKPVGRLVVDLEAVLASSAGSATDVALRDGDRLVVPKFRQEVTVLGEVQSPTSHLHRAGLDRDDYLALSGGLTRRADKSRIYVVRADGSVMAGSRGGLWGFGARGLGRIQPGDVIVAPLDTERLPPLPLWQAITGIIYNSAVAVAAVGSL